MAEVNPELQLIAQILYTEHGLSKATEWGLREDDFRGDESRSIYQDLLAYSQGNQGRTMPPEIFNSPPFYGDFPLPNFSPTLRLDEICKLVRNQRLLIDARAHLSRGIKRLGEEHNPDPVEISSEVVGNLKHILDMGHTIQSDVGLGQSLDAICNRYELKEQGVYTGVCRWPWEPIEIETDGVQSDDYIVYYGRPKSKKSFVLSYHAAFSYLDDKRVLLYTKEMSAMNLHMRTAAFIADLPYRDLRLAKLSPEERERLMNLRAMVKNIARNDDRLICLSGKDAPGKNDTVGWLHAKVERYRPDIVFIDGMYLMANTRSHKNQQDHARVRDISRDIRQMILDTNTPVVATLQANRQAAKHQNAELDEIAFSDSIGQDATCIIRCIQEKATPTVALVVGGSREWDLQGIRINAQCCTNFRFHSFMSGKEIMKAKEGDTGENEEAPKTANGASKKSDAQRFAKAEKKAVNKQLNTIRI